MHGVSIFFHNNRCGQFINELEGYFPSVIAKVGLV
jgi:hypothetical protein